MPDEPDQRERDQYQRAQAQRERYRDDRDDRNDRDDRQTIGFAGFGVKVSIAGIYTIIIVLLCLFILVAGYHAIQAMAILRGEHGQLMSEMKVQNYLLSLPEAERPRLIPPPGFYDRIDPRRETVPESERREKREDNRERQYPMPEAPAKPSVEERRERWGGTEDGQHFVPVPD